MNGVDDGVWCIWYIYSIYIVYIYIYQCLCVHIMSMNNEMYPS